MIVAGQKEIFTKNFDSFPIQYPDFTTEKKSTKKSETYDTMGNLQEATEKAEGGAISYGSVGQAYQTTITNKTLAA
jgi:phage major head subunit gpT-like protein